MTIHREGKQLINILFGLLLMIYATLFLLTDNRMIIGSTIIFTQTIFLLVLQFFRNPSRNTPVNHKHVIAPADGKIVVIEEVEEPEYFKGKRKQVSIFMSPFDVHINRNPVSGIVKYFKYHPGLYLVAWHPKSSTENERTTLVIENENGQEVLFRQIAGALARRIVWYVKEGDNVQQGSEFGFIKFGSRVDIFLPLDAKVVVNLNDKPVGGETVIAELP